MKTDLSHLDKFRVVHPLFNEIGDVSNMCIRLMSPVRNDFIFCICSDGGGWDHVSVSLKSRKMPNWDEMCFVKGLFFDDSECVLQFHPPKSEYVNNHATCLHLWKKQDFDMPLPDSIMVGIKQIDETVNISTIV
jgi:hypothetical protein